MAIYDITQTTIIPSKLKAGDIINCPYSGLMKSIDMPSGIYQLEAWGAMGGYRSNIAYAGKGGYVKGVLTLPEQKTLFLYVGGMGNSGTLSGTIHSGGFNGGGKRSYHPGGGGASDIRIGTDSLYARVIVAGGGGSDGQATKNGMFGGGLSGGNSTQNYGTGGYGGTQTGNSGNWITPEPSSTASTVTDVYSGFGFGGNGVYRSSGYGGAGGGGWYGGSGAYPDSSGDDDRGGGGGSGYIYNSDYATNYPVECLLTPSYYLSNTSIMSGNTTLTLPNGTASTGVADNGYIRITIMEIFTSFNLKVKINDEWKISKKVFAKINNEWKNVTSIYTKVNSIWEKSN